MLIVRFLIYIAVVALIFVDARTLDMLHRIGVDKDPYLELILLLMYLSLLYWQLKSSVSREKQYSCVMRESVKFSFLVGITWGFLTWLAPGVPSEIPTSDVIVLIGWCLLIGSFFAAVGWLISRLFWHYFGGTRVSSPHI
jgi:hypothetical protein